MSGPLYRRPGVSFGDLTCVSLDKVIGFTNNAVVTVDGTKHRVRVAGARLGSSSQALSRVIEAFEEYHGRPEPAPTEEQAQEEASRFDTLVSAYRKMESALNDVLDATKKKAEMENLGPRGHSYQAIEECQALLNRAAGSAELAAAFFTEATNDRR